MLQFLNQIQHLRHIGSGARLVIGRLYPERRSVLVHGINEPFGELTDGLAVLECTADNFVIDVSDVADIRDIQPAGPQPALHHIKYHHHACMAQMAVVINGHAADVETDLASLDWGKGLLITRQRVVDFEIAHGREIGSGKNWVSCSYCFKHDCAMSPRW